MSQRDEVPRRDAEEPARRWAVCRGAVAREAIIGLAIATALLTPGLVRAQAPDGRDWVGKRVVQRFHGLELRETQSSESREPDRVEIYRVERVRDRWLWLEAEETKTSGWVLASQVIPVERAIEYFSDRARRNPDDPWCYLMRSRLWHDKGRLDRALADCNEVIRLVPDDAAPYSNRGVVWSAMKKPDNAIDDYTMAIELNPRSSDAFLGRGTVWREKKEYDIAIADFNEAIRNDHRNVAAYNGRGLARYEKVEYDLAITDFDELIRINPRFAWAYHSRGRARHAKHDYAKAIVDYGEAIRLDPDEATTYENRGLAWSAQKEYDKAIADFNEAIRLDPKYASAYDSRGRAWSDKKEYDKAITDFDKAIRLDPKKAFSHYSRAAILFLTRREGAADAAQAVLDLQGWRGNLSMYAALLDHFVARRAGQDGRAKEILDAAKARCDTSAWPYPIIAYLRGELDEAKLLASAIDHDKMTEARCYLGLQMLTMGRKAAAEAHFRWVKDRGISRFTQHALSVAELDRLLAERTQGDGP